MKLYSTSTTFNGDYDLAYFHAENPDVNKIPEGVYPTFDKARIVALQLLESEWESIQNRIEFHKSQPFSQRSIISDLMSDSLEMSFRVERIEKMKETDCPETTVSEKVIKILLSRSLSNS